MKQGDIAIKTAVVAIDSLRSGMKNETSGQDAVDYVYATYETAIQISRQLEKVEPGVGHLSNAYAFAERSKANTLKTNLAEKDLRQSANIPDSLLWQENKAKAFVARWEGKNQDSLYLPFATWKRSVMPLKNTALYWHWHGRNIRLRH